MSTDDFFRPAHLDDDRLPSPPDFAGEPVAEPPPSPPGPPHPGFGFALLWCVAMLFLTQVPGAVVALGLLTFMLITDPDRYGLAGAATQKEFMQSEGVRLALAPGLVVAHLLLIGFSLLVIRLVVGRDWTRQLALRRPRFGHVVLAVLALPALSFLADGVYALIRHLLPGLANLGISFMEDTARVLVGWPWAFAVFAVGVLPGISEELWCRGFLGRGLVGRYGPLLGVVFTSFFFGLIHIDPLQGTMAMLIGLCLHFTYLMTRSLWVPILLHMLNNALAVTLPRSPPMVQAFGDPLAVPAYLYLASALLLGAVGWTLWVTRARLVSVAEPWQPPYPGVAYPPLESGTVVVRPAPGAREIGLVAVAAGAFLGALYAALRAGGVL